MVIFIAVDDNIKTTLKIIKNTTFIRRGSTALNRGKS